MVARACLSGIVETIHTLSANREMMTAARPPWRVGEKRGRRGGGGAPRPSGEGATCQPGWLCSAPSSRRPSRRDGRRSEGRSGVLDIARSLPAPGFPFSGAEQPLGLLGRQADELLAGQGDADRRQLAAPLRAAQAPQLCQRDPVAELVLAHAALR